MDTRFSFLTSLLLGGLARHAPSHRALLLEWACRRRRKKSQLEKRHLHRALRFLQHHPLDALLQFAPAVELVFDISRVPAGVAGDATEFGIPDQCGDVNNLLWHGLYSVDKRRHRETAGGFPGTSEVITVRADHSYVLAIQKRRTHTL